MLEIRKAVLSFNEQDLMQLERIIIDNDEKGAFLCPSHATILSYLGGCFETLPMIEVRQRMIF